jgi:hypothetical protein
LAGTVRHPAALSSGLRHDDDDLSLNLNEDGRLVSDGRVSMPEHPTHLQALLLFIDAVGIGGA